MIYYTRIPLLRECKSYTSAICLAEFATNTR
jgi:hypothetical protein